MSAITQAKLDEIFELLIAGSNFQDDASGKYCMITSRRTSARLDQAILRDPKRRARRKAHTRR